VYDSNNCKPFGAYYHEKDDCCEKSSAIFSDKPTPRQVHPGQRWKIISPSLLYICSKVMISGHSGAHALHHLYLVRWSGPGNVSPASVNHPEFTLRTNKNQYVLHHTVMLIDYKLFYIIILRYYITFYIPPIKYIFNEVLPNY
jgi:hypothetical protein